jgi:peptidoglycan-associated lipoprotein
MRTKTFAVLIAMVFLGSFLFVSCAKKQVEVTETVKPVAQEAKPAAPPPPPTPPPKPPEEVKKVEVGDTEAYKLEEAKRQAKLRELEAAKRHEEEVRAFESEKIYFDFDKSDVRPDAEKVLRGKGQWLRANPSYYVRIEGHCDERGTNEYNLALGDRRAVATKKYLVAFGIEEARISSISYGEERPAVLGQNEDAWAKNRRAEFKLLK